MHTYNEYTPQQVSQSTSSIWRSYLVSSSNSNNSSGSSSGSSSGTSEGSSSLSHHSSLHSESSSDANIGKAKWSIRNTDGNTKWNTSIHPGNGNKNAVSSNCKDEFMPSSPLRMDTPNNGIMMNIHNSNFIVRSNSSNSNDFSCERHALLSLNSHDDKDVDYEEEDHERHYHHIDNEDLESADHRSPSRLKSQAHGNNNCKSALLLPVSACACSRDSCYRCGNVMVKTLLWGTVLTLLCGVIWYSVEYAHNGTNPHLIAWFSAAAFVLTSFPISVYGIVLHLIHYYCPEIQIYVIRILWMVPIYSIESWLCLRYLKYAIFIETLRDCYESYVLYCFFQYLIAVLGGRQALILLLKDKSPTRGVHFWGVQCCVKPWIMGAPVSTLQPSSGNKGSRHIQRQWTSPFFTHCEFGILQYVLCKVFTSIATLVMEWVGVYKEGDFSWKAGYFYCTIINNFSQCWALYCLVIFYKSTKNELAPIRPIGKFLSVKMLVFFTWWQALGISVLFYAGFIPTYADEEHTWSAEEVSKAIQDYLICIEMFLFAVVHLLVFPYTDYVGGKRGFTSKRGRGIISPNSSIIQRNVIGRRKQLQGHHERSSDNEDDLIHLIARNSSGTCEVQSRSSDSPRPAFSSSISHRVRVNQMPSFDDDGSVDMQRRTGFLQALWQSTVPEDLMNNSIGIINGNYKVEKNTLLSHSRSADHSGIFHKQVAHTLSRDTTNQANEQNQQQEQVPGITTHESSESTQER